MRKREREREEEEQSEDAFDRECDSSRRFAQGACMVVCAEQIRANFGVSKTSSRR